MQGVPLDLQDEIGEDISALLPKIQSSSYLCYGPALHLSFRKSCSTVPIGKKSRYSILGSSMKPYFL